MDAFSRAISAAWPRVCADDDDAMAARRSTHPRCSGDCLVSADTFGRAMFGSESGSGDRVQRPVPPDDLYVCELTGRTHLCTRNDCTQRTDSGECMLTGNVHPPSLDAPLPSGTGESNTRADKRRRLCDAVEGRSRGITGSTHRRREADNDIQHYAYAHALISDLMDTKTSSEMNRAVLGNAEARIDRVYKEYLGQRRKCHEPPCSVHIAELIVNTLRTSNRRQYMPRYVSCAGSSPGTPISRDQYATLTVDLWQKLSGTSYVQAADTQFVFTHYVLALMYVLRDGLRDPNTKRWIVIPRLELAGRLPNLNALDRVIRAPVTTLRITRGAGGGSGGGRPGGGMMSTARMSPKQAYTIGRRHLVNALRSLLSINPMISI